VLFAFPANGGLQDFHFMSDSMKVTRRQWHQDSRHNSFLQVGGAQRWGALLEVPEQCQVAHTQNCVTSANAEFQRSCYFPKCSQEEDRDKPIVIRHRGSIINSACTFLTGCAMQEAGRNGASLQSVF
jgi:hypothetical protein